MTDKFEFIDAEYAIYLESDERYVPSIVKMCGWMEVSRSGFYEWRNAPESATAKRRGTLALYVQKSFDDSDGTYGYRRVHADLEAVRIREGNQKPLVAWFGGIPLKRRKTAVIADRVPGRAPYPRKEIISRLQRNRCELCQHSGQVQVHHVARLADLAHPGPGPGPGPGQHGPGS